MNRTDRLLGIVLELQSRGHMRAQDLAALFEVTKRTIYRDIQALAELGIPILSMTGSGYSLMEGFFLPPLSFNSQEALMMLLGCEMMSHHFAAPFRTAAECAAQKIRAVLPPAIGEEVQHWRESLVFFIRDTPDSNGRRQTLSLLWQAITNRQRVRFDYQKRYVTHQGEEAAIREVDPYGVAYLGNDWYLLGHCHLRHDQRVFRLSRINNLVLLNSSFSPPPTTRADWITPNNNRTRMVRAIFDPEVWQWVQESRSYYIVAEEETPEGWLVILQVRQEDEVFQWLLSWGAKVKVLEPADLRQKLVATAQQIIQKYQG